MVVAGAHTRVLCSASDNLATIGALDTWEQLHPSPATVVIGGSPASPPVPAQPHDKPVPLMLKDPSALLIQFLLLAPPHPPYLDIRKCTRTRPAAPVV